MKHTSARKVGRPHNHLVLLCQSCHGDLHPCFIAADHVTVWQCASCKEWFVYSRFGWARVDGAAALSRRVTRG